MKFYNPNKAPLFERLVAALVFQISKVKFISSKLRYVGEIADFSYFLTKNFGRINFRIRRENIWRDIEKCLKDEVIFIELGVASGYLTGWWLSPLRESLSIRKYSYHGFDSFEGLPAKWKDLEVGAFSTAGKVPSIDNSELRFHIGLVEDTLNVDQAKKIFSKNQTVVFFDLDLFGPSYHAYSVLKPHLKVNDIIYFDEARDADERKLLEMHIMKDFLLIPISASYSNVAFSIAGSRLKLEMDVTR